MKPLPTPLIAYDTFTTVEKIGGFPIHLHSLKDMDKALDEICAKYDPTTPEEEDRLLNLCPYFGVVWPSARALATFMSERKSQFTKKRGIEVGCGLGLPAILGAKIGAQMVATDFHPDVKLWVEKNAALNDVKIQYVEWDWTEDRTAMRTSPDDPIQFGTYDFVLASDVLYERRHPEELAQALARLVSPTGSIYLSDPGRAYLDRALGALEYLGFRRIDFNFDVEESSSRAEIRLEKKRNVLVYEFIR
ncbi:MAG: methyltransferase domain-containing protein [Bdellovibrionales bacterium]|nr:methyltransferase domain-containing protein [Bdellovibrionales bacterium]